MASASFLLPTSWPQIATTYFADVVFFPLGFQRRARRLRADDHVGPARRTAPGTRRTYGNGGTPRTMSAIALLTACDQASACFRSASPVSATAFSSAGLPSFGSRATQSTSPLGCGDVDAAGLHFRPAPQPVELLDERRKAIDPAALRVQVDELGRLAGVLAHALQLVVVDEIRDEALLVLQLHRVEDAAVGVDADQKIVLGCDGEHGPHFTGQCRRGRGGPFVAAIRPKTEPVVR